MIIVSASSDIGAQMALHWVSLGWDVYGTYRTKSTQCDELESQGIHMISCDLGKSDSVDRAVVELSKMAPRWDVLVLCPGTQLPIGPFMSCDFQEWEASIEVNFTRQLQLVHGLLPSRGYDIKNGPLILFFAGGGTNNATVNYSAYTLSKIALIKACELLDAEIPDTRFSIIGPGWVKTKIHQETLDAGPDLAGKNFQITQKKVTEPLTPMRSVIDCAEWIIQSSKDLISGRNFSVVHDDWGKEHLAKKLKCDTNIYKLRRHGNDYSAKDVNP
jgi:NAD(P)-dependent dehydrogenase (short-subunit alcohol dehydrogenase family)